MHWNQKYFDGRLSADVCAILETIQFQNEEEERFLERLFRFMNLARFDARDFSSMLAWILKVLPSRLLPFAWGGIIPPITIANRHNRINDYIRSNPWVELPEQAHFLDLGCGFPPVTTVELAAAFPNVRVTGADPAFATEILYDADGNYACFYGDEDLPRYFQLVTGDLKKWEEFFSDMNATKLKFAEMRDNLRAGHSTGRLVRNPLVEYETDRLSFRQAGFFEFEMTDLDVIRCFNVLIYYNAAYRQSVLDWAVPMLRQNGLLITGMDWLLTSYARYTVYQKVQDTLQEREFAFSVDNIRPLGILSWFTLHDDEPETIRMCELVGLLRSDDSFRTAYDARLDELLLEFELCKRNSEGYIQVIDPNRSAADSQQRSKEVNDRMEREDFAAKAVEVLRAANINAIVNSVGHIAVLRATEEIGRDRRPI